MVHYILTDKQLQRFWGYVDMSAGVDGCWLWTGTRLSNRYGRFGLNEKIASAHRIAYSLAYGDIPDGLLVCHKCDNPPCCNPSHLFLGTYGDNARDRAQKGRSNNKIGDRHPMSKLTSIQIDEIRAKYKSGNITQRLLAKQYGVTSQTINRIIAGDYWK